MAKPFDLRELGARVKALIRAARRERDRNPTTNLPGSRAIDEEIEGALKSGKPTAVVHIDILNFDATPTRSASRARRTRSAASARWLLEAARAASGGGAFVGHIGGSDFIAVLSPEHAEPFLTGRRGRVRRQALDAAGRSDAARTWSPRSRTPRAST